MVCQTHNIMVVKINSRIHNQELLWIIHMRVKQACHAELPLFPSPTKSEV